MFYKMFVTDFFIRKFGNKKRLLGLLRDHIFLVSLYVFLYP